MRLHPGKHTNFQYVISRQENASPDLLRISLEAGDEEALPVFSSERLARGFLRCCAPDRSGTSGSRTTTS